MKEYLGYFLVIIMLKIQGMHGGRAFLERNNSPIFIKKVTNNSHQTVTVLKSHFFGYLTQEDKDAPIVTLPPGQIKDWEPLLPMPYSSVHFLAEFHAFTMMAQGGYEDQPGSGTFNTCLLTYWKPDLIHVKLLKNHSYTLEIVLGDREKDNQVQFDKMQISEQPQLK